MILRTSFYLINYFRGNALCLSRGLSTVSFPVQNLNKTGKKFREGENEFAHHVISNLPQYKNSIVDHSLIDTLDIKRELIPSSSVSWESIPMNELCDKFKIISLEARKNSTPISDQCYSEMCTSISKRCIEMTDEQLYSILNHLALWPFTETAYEKNFRCLWSALDNTCVLRWKSWNVDKILQFADLWYNIRLTRQSSFVFYSITKLASKPSKLLPHQLIQLLFFLNLMRTLSKRISMYEVEFQFEKIVNQISLQELGVAVMGFFKTQNPIHSEKLIELIIDRVIQEKGTVPEVTLTCILKVLRLSLRTPSWKYVPKLIDVLESELDRFTLQGLSHINLLAAKALTFNENLIKKLCQKTCDSVKEARLKDLEKVLYLLVLFNYNPRTVPCIFELFVEELNDTKRLAESVHYPISYAVSVYYLTVKNIFVENAVKKVLDMDFIRKTYGRTNYKIGREILGIDTYIDLMQPTYNGPRLPVEVRNYLSKRYSEFVPNTKYKQPLHRKFAYDVFQTVQALTGENNAIFKYVLPHFSRADLILKVSPEGLPLPMSDDYKNIEDFTGPIRAPTDGKWYSIVCGSRNVYIQNVPIYTGETSSKLLLLKQLGYEPVLISFLDWPTDEDEKLAYLKKSLKLLK